MNELSLNESIHINKKQGEYNSSFYIILKMYTTVKTILLSIIGFIVVIIKIVLKHTDCFEVHTIKAVFRTKQSRTF